MNAAVRKRPMTPVTRTKAAFCASFGVLFPCMTEKQAELAWRDLRAAVELEEIVDLTRRMSAVGCAVMQRQTQRGGHGRI